MKMTILTLGCKVNQAESAFIEGNILGSGNSIVPLSEHPDYCIINTCSVTAKSDYQSRQLIRRAVRSGAKVIVTGCYSQLRAEEIRTMEGDITIVQNSAKLQLINILPTKPEATYLPLNGRSRPFVKIQDGCNFTCTYCIVPKARGRSRSLAVSDVLEQVLKLESCGFNEIVLTGIHLGSYGKDLSPQLKLSDIITILLDNTRLRRIRLSSIEMNEVDAELLDLLQEERICKHLHIPLQSGDDSILKHMNRAYSAKAYVRVIESALTCVPDIAIGTDIIVGFPGEGEKEFLNSKSLLDSLPLAYIHVFPFSLRPETAACTMSSQVSSAVKKERAKALNDLNIGKKFTYMSSHVNKTLDVVVEELPDDQTAIGTSGNYLKVKVCSNACPKQSLVYVRTTGIEGDLLSGVPIEKP